MRRGSQGNACPFPLMRERLASEPGDGNVPLRKRLAWRPTAGEIVQVVRAHFRVPTSAFGAVRRRRNDARVAAIYLVRHLTDQTVSATAGQFGGVSAAAISKVVKRADSRRNDDPKWNRLLASWKNDAPANDPPPALSLKSRPDPRHSLTFF